jgi:hypothetical protein
MLEIAAQREAANEQEEKTTEEEETKWKRKIISTQKHLKYIIFVNYSQYVYSIC